MRFVPEGTYRRRGTADRPPTWYHWFYRGPESDGEEVLLGQSQRLKTHLDHKFYPADGTWPQTWHGAVRGVEWLLECWRSARARSDAIRTQEDEEIHSELCLWAWAACRATWPPGHGAHASVSRTSEAW